MGHGSAVPRSMSFTTLLQKLHLGGKNMSNLLSNDDAAEIIKDRLYIGTREAGLNVVNSSDNFGITHVLNVERGAKYPKSDSKLSYLHVPMSDSGRTDLDEALPAMLEFIHNAITQHKKNRVLVHCALGLNRSVTVVLAYLMKHKGMSFADALALLKAKRPQLRVHDKYIEYLKQM